MNGMNYAGLDIHKKSISCCVRQADGTIIQESTIAATRHALDEWNRRLAVWCWPPSAGFPFLVKGELASEKQILCDSLSASPKPDTNYISKNR